MYLILAQIHLHNVNLVHRIQRKINTLKKEKNTFWNQYEIAQYEIRDDEKIREGVARRKKVITKDHYLILTINFSNVCILVNYFLISFWQT